MTGEEKIKEDFLPRHTGWRFGRGAAKSAVVPEGRKGKASVEMYECDSPSGGEGR